MSAFLGIDPGKEGAFAIVSPDGKARVFDMPVATVGKRKCIDENAVLEMFASADLHPAKITFAVIEKVWGIKGQGAGSAFNFGAGYGLIRGMLLAHGHRWDAVPPQRWKKSIMSGPTGKDAARLQARRMWPALADQLKLKKHDGRAEALLIAEYARRTYG